MEYIKPIRNIYQILSAFYYEIDDLFLEKSFEGNESAVKFTFSLSKGL